MTAPKKRAGKAKPVAPTAIVEELCNIDRCTRRGTHWHLFSLEGFASVMPGEYTLTLRVRHVARKPRRTSR